MTDTNEISEKPLIMEKLFSIHKGSRLYYNILMSKEKHNFCSKWENKIDSGINWKNLYLKIKSVNDIKLRWFNIRLISRILGTNITLKCMGLRNNDLCSFCNQHRESLIHLFIECNVVKDFWTELKDVFVKITLFRIL